MPIETFLRKKFDEQDEDNAINLLNGVTEGVQQVSDNPVSSIVQPQTTQDYLAQLDNLYKQAGISDSEVDYAKREKSLNARMVANNAAKAFTVLAESIAQNQGMFVDKAPVDYWTPRLNDEIQQLHNIQDEDIRRRRQEAFQKLNFAVNMTQHEKELAQNQKNADRSYGMQQEQFGLQKEQFAESKKQFETERIDKINAANQEQIDAIARIQETGEQQRLTEGAKTAGELAELDKQIELAVKKIEANKEGDKVKVFDNNGNPYLLDKDQLEYIAAKAMEDPSISKSKVMQQIIGNGLVQGKVPTKYYGLIANNFWQRYLFPDEYGRLSTTRSSDHYGAFNIYGTGTMQAPANTPSKFNWKK